MNCLQLEAELENLGGSGYKKYPISPKTLGRIGYNCIAFAAGDTTQRWWPSPYRALFYWPSHLEREVPGSETIQNFVLAFESIGYRTCKDGKLRRGVEKIVVFANGNTPTHAARQLETGVWISKCGRLEDIMHETLASVEGAMYGKAHTFMHRRRDGKLFLRDRVIALLRRFKVAS